MQQIISKIKDDLQVVLLDSHVSWDTLPCISIQKEFLKQKKFVYVIFRTHKVYQEAADKIAEIMIARNCLDLIKALITKETFSEKTTNFKLY